MVPELLLIYAIYVKGNRRSTTSFFHCVLKFDEAADIPPIPLAPLLEQIKHSLQQRAGSISRSNATNKTIHMIQGFRVERQPPQATQRR